MPDRASILARNNVAVQEAPEGAPTIVFAHGFGTDQTAWDKQTAHLRGKYRCVKFDHVGSGHSDIGAFHRSRYATLYGYAQDLIEICDAMDLRDVRLVGHSVSGMVSMLASILRRDLFSALMVIGASPRYLNESHSGYVGGFEETDAQGLFDAMAANYHGWASGFAPVMMGNPERPHLAEYFCETLLSIRPDVAQSVLRTIILSDHRDELARVTIPVWVAYADQDMAVPESVSAYLADHIPGSHRQLLAATGHLPHISAPATVNSAMERWLEWPAGHVN